MAAGQPRSRTGQFKPGYMRWQRETDGDVRWIWWPRQGSDPEPWESHWLTDESRRLLTHLALLVVVAFLVIWNWPL